MNIFLAGPAGPEQVATKWLLDQRGYHTVVCESDLLQKSYPYNAGMRPSPRNFLRFRALELAQARVCVIGDDLCAQQRAEVMAAARYAGIPVLHYDRLPAQAPSIMREDELMDALTSGEGERAPLRQRLAAWADRANKAFDARFGWFFVNGNKAAMRGPRPYAEVRTKAQTTA